MGSSHAYRGFSTEIFLENGYRTFNLGSSSQTPAQTIVLLKRYLENLNPKLVIYEVYPRTLSTDGVESALDIISNDKNDLHSLKMAFQINNIKIYNTLIYSFIRDLLGLNKFFTESVNKGNDKYVSGGFVKKEMGFYKPSQLKKKVISLNNYQLEQFSEIRELLRIKNIELILVFAPISKAKYNSYVNKTYFDSLMESYAKYYNFNEIISLNDSLHFYDSDHLNQNGVVIFNKSLIEILNK